MENPCSQDHSLVVQKIDFLEQRSEERYQNLLEKFAELKVDSEKQNDRIQNLELSKARITGIGVALNVILITVGQIVFAVFFKHKS